MSYDLKIRRYCDHRLYNEEQIVEEDGKTITLEKSLANNDVNVKVNGFEIPKDNVSEISIVDNITDKFNGTNNVFFLNNNPIYNGQDFGIITNNVNDIIIQIKQENEDVSSQITGGENFFVTNHKPIISEFNFSSIIQENDIEVKVNNLIVDIIDIDSLTGRITINQYPLATDTVTVTYYYKASITQLNGETGLVRIEEIPDLNQTINAKYYIQIDDGWKIVSTTENNINKKIILFDRVKKTNRERSQLENVSSQFTGTEKEFYTQYSPLMPFEANLNTTELETLVNSVYITINGFRIIPTSINASIGKIILPYAPKATDTVLISYYYKNELTPDIITVDYTTYVESCPKCNGLEIYDDLEYDEIGKLKIVRNEDKLVQDLRKIVITEKGSNTEHPWYGTNLEIMIGQSLLPEFIRTQLAGEIQTAAQNLKSLQVQQESYQVVTDKEFIDFIDNLQVEQHELEPSLWKVSLDIINQSSEAVNLEEEILFENSLFELNSDYIGQNFEII